jgi:transcriptional regulator with XRE-family HTH domain
MSEVATSEEHAEFCERVKTRRKELGLTQAEMAEKLSMTQPSYAYIESGRREPGLNQVVKVAKALGLTVSDLFAEPAISRKR